jgi:DNA-binding transcriptional regulator YiaG
MEIADIDELESNSSKNAFIENADMKKTSKAANEKRKPGRPKKSDEDKATEQVFVNLTKAEKLKIDNFAKSLGISTSSLVKISLSKFGAL